MGGIPFLHNVIYGFTVYMGTDSDACGICSISEIWEMPALSFSRRGSYEVEPQRRDFLRHVYLFAG